MCDLDGRGTVVELECECIIAEDAGGGDEEDVVTLADGEYRPPDERVGGNVPVEAGLERAARRSDACLEGASCETVLPDVGRSDDKDDGMAKEEVDEDRLGVVTGGEDDEDDGDCDAVVLVRGSLLYGTAVVSSVLRRIYR